MNKGYMGAVLLTAISLAACGGGSSGSSNGGPIPNPGPTGARYSVSLTWAPNGNAGGLTPALRVTQAQIYRIPLASSSSTVVVQSADSGYTQGANGGVVDQDTGSSAIVTVQVSSAPNPMPTASFSTTSTGVKLQPTPSPIPGYTAAPNPAIGVLPVSLATTSSGTISANVGGTVSSDNLVELRSYAIYVYNSTSMQSASQTLGEYGAYTVDSNCNLVGQTSPAGADVYVTWSGAAPPFASSETQGTIHVPGGGVAIAHGYDPTTLTAAQWTNSATAFGLNTTYVTSLDDTIIFKAANGKIVYLGGVSSVTPGNGPGSAGISSAVGCLN